MSNNSHEDERVVNMHEGSPGDKHSTRVKVESDGNLANPTGCEEGVAAVHGLARAWACGRGDSSWSAQWGDALTAAGPLEVRP
jgi:hypothetical protein